jgi:transcriptional regulator with XRE-family HTH domain
MGASIITDIQQAQRLISAEIERAGLTRAQVAERLGVQPSTITHALNPDRAALPKPETLNQIAECVGLQVRVAVLASED